MRIFHLLPALPALLCLAGCGDNAPMAETRTVELILLCEGAEEVCWRGSEGVSLRAFQGGASGAWSSARAAEDRTLRVAMAVPLSPFTLQVRDEDGCEIGERPGLDITAATLMVVVRAGAARTCLLRQGDPQQALVLGTGPPEGGEWVPCAVVVEEGSGVCRAPKGATVHLPAPMPREGGPLFTSWVFRTETGRDAPLADPCLGALTCVFSLERSARIFWTSSAAGCDPRVELCDIGLSGPLRAVTGQPQLGSLWLSGASGAVFHRPNAAAAVGAQASEVLDDLHGLHVVGAQEVWAVGGGGTVLRHDGTRWTRAWKGGSDVLLYGVHRDGDTRALWAAGSGGNILRGEPMDGLARDMRRTTGLEVKATFYGIWMKGDQGWAVGTAGLFRYDGAKWSWVPMWSRPYYRLRMNDKGDHGFVVGEQKLLELSNGVWVERALDLKDRTILDLAALDQNRLRVVGRRIMGAQESGWTAVLTRGGGGFSTSMIEDFDAPLRSVYVAGGEVYVVGDEGRLRRGRAAP